MYILERSYDGVIFYSFFEMCLVLVISLHIPSSSLTPQFPTLFSSSHFIIFLF